MDLAGKYMMGEFAPHTLMQQEDPMLQFARARATFSVSGQSPAREIIAAHPQLAFDAQGLGFGLSGY